MMRKIFQVLLVLWSAALVFYFEMREGLVRWPWLFKPENGGGWFHVHGLPDPRLHIPDTMHAPVAPYVAIFKSLLKPWEVQWGNAPWLDLGIAALVIAGYVLLGWMLLSIFRIFVPRGARLCLALIVGTGVIGIGAELIAMANRLNRPWVWGLWIVAGLVATGAWVFQLRRRNDLRAFSAHTRLSPVEQQFLARSWFETYHPWPISRMSRLLFWLYLVLFAVITLFVTLHAVGEPVSYWDSLILYVGYARDIYLQRGFPVKVVGQVGLGLGANYPHLYELLSAQTAALAGHWSDTFAQLLPPVATAAAMVLVYYAVLELSRERLVALACALLVRSIPYGLSYSQFASNYSIAILYTAAFLYLAIKHVRDGLPDYRLLMLLTAAGAVHINYLMWGLWPVAAVAIILASMPRVCAAKWPGFDRATPPTDLHHERGDVLDFDYGSEAFAPEPSAHEMPPEPIALQERAGIRRLLTSARLWMGVALALIIASPWYVRNVVVTGNPVYAFYANIFPSKNVNPEVMKSAQREWLLNGDGLGRVGRTLGEKLANSWVYFVTGNQHWKLAPFFVGFVLPGFAIWLVWWLWCAVRRTRAATTAAQKSVSRVPPPTFFAALAAPAALLALLWFYAYAVADFYLYQIIIILPLFGIFAGCLFIFCRARGARVVLHALILVMAIAPGMAMAIMGFKLKKTGVYTEAPPPQMNATALRRLFMNPQVYYRMEYGGDMEMIARVNALPAGTVVLSHENRTLLLRPQIRIVNLDDWEVQKAYGKPAAERVRILDSLGVKYYLYVPNEDRHAANSWLGMDELIRDGYFRKIDESASPDSGDAGAHHDIIPAGKNVLYQRTEKP